MITYNNPYTVYRRVYESINSKFSVLNLTKTNIVSFIKKSDSLLLGMAKEALSDMSIDGIYELSVFLYDYFKYKFYFFNVTKILNNRNSFLKLIVDPIWSKINKFDHDNDFKNHMIKFIQNESIDVVIKLSKDIFKHVPTRIVDEFSSIVHFNLPKSFYNIKKHTFSNIIINKIERLKKNKNIIHIEDTQKYVECQICMDNFIDFELHPNNSFSHLICKNCLLSLPKKECPFCRKKFNTL